MRYYVYDLETFSNCFLFTGKEMDVPGCHIFEISPRTNQRGELLKWLSYLQNLGVHMVGFNSLSFDYPILHKLLTEPYTFSAEAAYLQAQQIINVSGYGRNPHSIPFKDRILPQIDLVKINHFDNAAKRTSLKALQFAMRADSVEDLPFDPETTLDSNQIEMLRSYNAHDVLETERFLKKCIPMIEMRKDLLEHGILSGDVLNYSDVKIGTEYLVSKIGRARCFIKGSNPRQTLRTSVPLDSVILPKIGFKTEPFRAVLDWFKQQTIWMGKEERPTLSRHLGNLDFFFGVGGVHASMESRVFSGDADYVIKDIDVGAMYPSLAVVNGFYPEHLGDAFVSAYAQLQRDRKQYAKGTMMNLVLKLANNGVFGNSNNSYSCFFDPKFTFSITVNGQLQLLQLAEYLHLIPGVQLIQANTDGITAFVPREQEAFFQLWCNEWECVTGLKLEHATFKRMWIRDVNNYVAEGEDGKIKRKGAYWYPLTDNDYHGSSGSNWNKDFSNLAAQRGVETCMLRGAGPRDAIRIISDPFDFMLRYKTPAGATVYIGDEPQLRTVRYYVSRNGKAAKKIARPKGTIGAFKRRNGITDEIYERICREIGDGVWDSRIHTKNKSKYELVETSIEAGRLVKACNKASDFNWQDVDFDYYEKEIEKLLIGEKNAV